MECHESANADGEISRRALLKATGIACVGFAPGVSVLGAALQWPFRIVTGDGRAAFMLGGRERWVIDIRRFGGRPRLKVESAEKTLRLELTDALYPGTTVCADMACEIQRRPGGWHMQLRLGADGFACEVPFEAWLAGAATAGARVSLSAVGCELAGAGRFCLAGPARAEFYPDWSLTLTGVGVARLSLSGAEVLSDAVTLSLPAPAEPSLSSRHHAKRTLVTLKRGGRSWPLQPTFEVADGWKLTMPDHAFDVIRLEASESARGATSHALLAESGAGDGSLTFQPTPHLTDNAGDAFALRLRAARYAVSFDHAGAQTALFARFAKEPVWLRHRGIGLKLGDADAAPPFELVCRNGQVTDLRCAPALLSIITPLAGAVVEAARAAPGSLIAFELEEGGSARRERVPDTQGTATHGRFNVNTRTPGVQGARLSQPLDGLSVDVLRPADFLKLTFGFRNFSLEESDSSAAEGVSLSRVLRRTKANAPAYVTVRFPPQHIAEEVVSDGIQPPPSGSRRGLMHRFVAASFQSKSLPFPVSARLAGESQLVFRVPDDVQEIPYTLESLLDWECFKLEVTPKALPPPLFNVGGSSPVTSRSVTPPSPTVSDNPSLDAFDESVTFIEAPYRLILSPHANAAWAHARAAVSHSGRTELWHTRLGVRLSCGFPAGRGSKVDERDQVNRTVRAIAAPGVDDADPFSMTLEPGQRVELVKLTFASKGFEDRYIEVERLMLTSLGAWLDLHYDAEPPPEPKVKLKEWKHRATMGRDHYVRVVEAGYIFPFGHRALRTTISERKFRRIDSISGRDESQRGQAAAYLLQRKFVTVRQPLKYYGANGPHASAGSFGDAGTHFKDDESIPLMFPFKSVRITTLVTPNLAEPTENQFLRVKTQQGEEKDFQFHLIAEDLDGHFSEFTAPLIFVPVNASTAELLDLAKKVYAPRTEARRRSFDGQKIAFAADETGQSATSFETSTITFDAFVLKDAGGVAAGEPPFRPVMTESSVRLQAVAQLLGTEQQPTIRYHREYLRVGFGGNNRGEVFVKVANESGQTMPLNFAGRADKAGGLATPSLNVNGLSRKFGPVADADNLAEGQFKPAKFFDKANAKLLGGIGLDEIISENFDDLKIPKLLNTVERNKDGAPVTTKTFLHWEPPLQSDPLNFFQPGSLSLDATLVTPLTGAEPTYNINGQLKDFGLSFLGLVIVNFKRLEFTAQSGKKLDVSAELRDEGPVTFGGPLAFLNVLAKVLPANGFSDPPSLDVSADGVTVGYSLALPSVEAGAWGFRDLKVSAGLTIPFTGEHPVLLRFAFSDRHNPFQVVVYGVTGGAFFAINVGLGHVESVEASFELGGSLGLNLGVASGALVAMVGIYMNLQTNGPHKGEVTLAGYVRLGGAMSVLGLVTVSVEYYLELAYNFASRQLHGEASMTVKVKVLLFSKKVTLRVVRDFNAPGEPPKIAHAGLPGRTTASELAAAAERPSAHMADAAAWASYCAAFA